ncbi:MAG: hypothetical protein ACRDTU_17035 [Micromonosporaceae bacterium]
MRPAIEASAPRIAVRSFDAITWWTAVRAVPLLAVAQLCLIPVILLVLLVLTPRSMVAVVGDAEVRLAPSHLWDTSMWWAMAALLAAVLLSGAWLYAWATLVAGAATLGRDLGPVRAARLSVRLIPRLLGPMVVLLVLPLSVTMLPWWIVVAVAAGLVAYLHPAVPLALLVGRRRWELPDAVAIARGQGGVAVTAAALIGTAYWALNELVAQQPFGPATGLFLWAVGSSLLVSVTGALLALAVLRPLGSAQPLQLAVEAAERLTALSEPRSRPNARGIGVTVAGPLALTACLSVGLSMVPVTSLASDPAGRGPSWTAQLPDWGVLAGEGGLSAYSAGDLVVVAVNRAEPPGVVVYRRDGTQLWSYPFRGESHHHLRYWITDDAVVLYGDATDQFRVLDLDTGRIRLTVKDQPNYEYGMVGEHTIVVADGSSGSDCWHPRAYDLRTGRQRWARDDRCLTPSGMTAPDNNADQIWTSERLRDRGTPEVGSGTSVLWALTRPADDKATRRAVALDLDTGEDLAKPYQVPAKTHGVRRISEELYLEYPKRDWSGTCRPSNARERPATIEAHDVKTGRLRWTAEVGRWNPDEFNDAACGPPPAGCSPSRPDNGCNCSIYALVNGCGQSGTSPRRSRSPAAP